MKFNILNPRKALNKAFLKLKPNRSDIELFKRNLIALMDSSNDIESEEFHKNLISDFLKDTYYKENHFINTKGRNDLVIHNGNSAKSSVGVIIEAKKPTNKAEMLRAGADGSTVNINTKAFQELVLYYLRERVQHKNLEIKHLIATNIYEWFVFDANVFEKCFAQNKQLVKLFTDFEDGKLSGKTTDFFYKEIAEPFIAELKQEIEFAYFDLRGFNQTIRNEDQKDDNKLIGLFKLLSPEHLLKLPFTNDSNSLDKRFYSELLHIIGLSEKKEKGKKLISRNDEGSRNSGSLIEDAIIQLDSLDKISRLENSGQYGNTHQEKLFNVALELSITWINRILFLKLLEAQLISYNKGNKSYSFLNIEVIKNYDDLNSLFFQVLAKKFEDRNEEARTLFSRVPYLNSSLFEPTELEHATLFISQLRDERMLPVFGSTVMKDQKGKKLSGEISTLEYLFEFLNAYDFASEGSEEIQEDNKTLINASVLGLIFEKINGYKDGSFFTPGFITMYMCRETIRKAVVQKFNEEKGWECEDLSSVYNKIENIKEANEIVNSIKICDPAVGSGHFLVSALNEMISVKNDLRILQDREGKRLKEYQFEVVNDELIVTDDEGDLFEYNPQSKESQRVQETLFHEKQTIIENCLFGVDINPNSVKICRLRLWIELLKNAYYKSETELETLPNIDINIKCGNSLVSRFAIDADLGQALKNSKWTIDSYRNAVATYRNAKSKEEKREMERLIATIKSDFRSEISLNDPKIKRLSKLRGDLFLLTNQTTMFEMGKKEKADWNKKVKKLSEETKKLETEIEEIKSNKIFENAFEWRFEFPEVLNGEGDFVGFDVVIGNPPYIRRTDISEIYKESFEKNYVAATKQYDLYLLFIELGMNLLKQKGKLTFINPMFFVNESGYGIRKLLLEKYDILNVLNLSSHNIFEEASTYPCVVEISNEFNKLKKTNFYNDNKITISNNLELQSPEFFTRQDFDSNKNLLFDFSEDRKIRDLAKKINSISIELGELYECFRGTPNTKIEFNENGNYFGIKSKSVRKYSTIRDFEKINLTNESLLNNDELILIPRTVLELACTIKDVSNDIVVLDRIYCLKKKNPDINNYIILSLLNSRLMNFWFSFNFSSTKVRGGYFDLRGTQIVKMPIIRDYKNISIELEQKVKKILDLKNSFNNSSKLLYEIDRMVYELYGLSDEEIKIVEGNG
jgi:adenine-specific DNA-methyltransferase